MKGKLIDINAGRQHAHTHSRVRPLAAQNHRPVQALRRVPHGKTRQLLSAVSSAGCLGPLLFIAGVLGLLLDLRANPEALEPLFIGFICIATAFLGACKATHEITDQLKNEH